MKIEINEPDNNHDWLILQEVPFLIKENHSAHIILVYNYDLDRDIFNGVCVNQYQSSSNLFLSKEGILKNYKLFEGSVTLSNK